MINLEIQGILKKIEILDIELTMFQKISTNNPDMVKFVADEFKKTDYLHNLITKDVEEIEFKYNTYCEYYQRIKKDILQFNVIDNEDSFERNRLKMLYKYERYAKRFNNLIPYHQKLEYDKFIEFAELEHINGRKRTSDLICDRYCLTNLFLEMEPSLTKLKSTFRRDHTTICYVRDKHFDNLKYYPNYAERYRVIGNLLLTYIFTEA